MRKEHETSSKLKAVRRIYFYLFFTLVVFLGSCNHFESREKTGFSSLSKAEKADLESLFNLLLFENYGAFVLFGSKPVCEMSLVDPVLFEIEEKKRLAMMSLEEKSQWEQQQKAIRANKNSIQLKHDPYKGWEAWKKVSSNLPMKGYILTLCPQGNNAGVYFLLLANIQKTVLILAENYNIFREASGMDFDPSEIVLELKNPESIFWSKVFEMNNHLAKGLLFGFGKENALFFDKKMKSPQKEDISEGLREIPYKISTQKQILFGHGNISNFTIPLFGVVEGSDVPERYEKEKKEIEEAYRNKDLIRVTLEHLTKCS